MTWIKGLFWNREQDRLRTAWRLIGQLIILLVVVIIPETILGVIASGMLIAQRDLAQSQLADPFLVQSMIMNDPLIIMILYAGVAPSVVVSVWFSGRFLDRRPFADFGFHLRRDWWVEFGFGMGLGAFLMGVIFMVEWSAGWVTVLDTFVIRNSVGGFIPAISLPLLTYLAVGFYEELFSRGYHLKNLAEGLNLKWLRAKGAIFLATVLSSLIFGALHAMNPFASLTSTLNISLAGLLLATGYILTGELAIPIGLHVTWNFFQGNVFGFPVSGANLRSAAFLEIQQKGPDLWTGGHFGPEAGLVGLGAMVLGMALIILWVWWRTGKVSLFIPLAEPPQGTDKKETSQVV